MLRCALHDGMLFSQHAYFPGRSRSGGRGSVCGYQRHAAQATSGTPPAPLAADGTNQHIRQRQRLGMHRLVGSCLLASQAG